MHAQESAKSLEASRQKAKFDAEVCSRFLKLEFWYSQQLADIQAQFTCQAEHAKAAFKYTP